MSREITKNSGRKLYIEPIEDRASGQGEFDNSGRVLRALESKERLLIKQKPLMSTRDGLTKVVQTERKLSTQSKEKCLQEMWRQGRNSVISKRESNTTLLSDHEGLDLNELAQLHIKSAEKIQEVSTERFDREFPTNARSSSVRRL